MLTLLATCRSVRTRRFQTLSTQDLCQFLIVGVLSGLFWLQRAKNDTTAAASDTLGEALPSAANLCGFVLVVYCMLQAQPGLQHKSADVHKKQIICDTDRLLDLGYCCGGLCEMHDAFGPPAF